MGALRNSRFLVSMSIPSKLIEVIPKIRICRHLDKTGLFENQCGFCEEKSCIVNKLFEGVNRNANRGDQDHPIYLDFRKPFD